MSGIDPRGATPGPTAALAESFPVAPVLVRDYRRLLRLFPSTYRRAHEAEMLGHLLDGAAPGQSRPSGAERWDLLRAASREWLLAPFGSTPAQWRASTAILVVVLPVLLAFPIGRSLGSAVLTLADPGVRHLTLIWAPTGPAWAIWAVAIGLLLAGRARAGRAVGVAGTGVLVATLVLLAVRGEWHDVSRELGWLAPTTALLVVAGWRRERTPLVPRRAVVAAVLAGIVLVESVRVAIAAVLPTEWTPATMSTSWWALGMTTPLLLAGVLACGGLLLHASGRQVLPVLLSVIAGLWLGRFGLTALTPLNGPDATAIWPQVVGVVAVAATARWVVNRADEITAARARSDAEKTARRTPGTGEPTAV